jgi:hypothetical protein
MSKARKLWESIDELPRLFIVAQFLGLFLGVLFSSFVVSAIVFGSIFVPCAFVYITKVAYQCDEALDGTPPNYFL